MKETMERDGRKWTRLVFGEKPEPFWTADEPEMELRCGCWADAGFNVTFGSYEVFGECRACHAASSIYN